MKVAPPPVYSSEDVRKMLEPKTYDMKKASPVVTNHSRHFTVSADESARRGADQAKPLNASATDRNVILIDTSPPPSAPFDTDGNDDLQLLRPSNDNGGKRVGDQTSTANMVSADRKCGKEFACDIDFTLSRQTTTDSFPVGTKSFAEGTCNIPDISFAIPKVELIDETKHNANNYCCGTPIDSGHTMTDDSARGFVHSCSENSNTDLVVKIIKENVFYDCDVQEPKSEPSIEVFDNELKFIKRCQKCCRARILDDFTWNEVPKPEKIKLMDIILEQTPSKMQITKDVDLGTTCNADDWFHDI